MRTKPTLEKVRAAIVRRRIVSFFYRGHEVRVEPRILGNVVRTHAFVVLGWQLDADEGWQLYRYAEMYDFKVSDDQIEIERPPCGPLRRKVVEMDTWAMPVPD